MTDYVELAIYRGLSPYPGDTNYLEAIDDIIDLYNARGFSVKETDGWTPKLPATRNGGSYVTSPISEGGIPYSLVADNIEETINLSSAVASYANRYWLENRLNLMGHWAREHWTGNSLQPVYLKWRAPGSPGAQYALIYDIQIANSEQPTLGEWATELTITVKREPGWRGIPPYANPKLWTWGSSSGSGDLRAGSSNHLFSGSLVNRIVNNSSGVPVSVNYVDIPGENIPGDLPALLYLNVEPNEAATAYTHIMVAQSVKPPTLLRHDTGATLYRTNLLNAWAASGFNAEADTGANPHPSTGLTNRHSEVFTSGADAGRLSWLIDATMYRGKYAAFIRARQDGAAAGNITMHMRYAWQFDNLTAAIDTPVVQPVRVDGTGNTVGWPLTYMGVIEIPPNINVPIDTRGFGIHAPEPGATGLNFTVQLWAARSTGTAKLYVNDIVLIPYDDAPFLKAEPATGVLSTQAVLDNTGYFSRRGTDDVVSYVDSTIYGIQNQLAQFGGAVFMLQPGVNNRLYFLVYDDNNLSKAGTTIGVLGDIVPRWSGVRDK